MGELPVSSLSTIQGCTIQNNSDGDCDVEVEYGVNGQHRSKLKFGVGKNQQREQKEKKITDLSGGRVRINIVRITIMRRNGEKIRLSEPFNDVYKPSPNWLFTITNDEFCSTKSLDSY